MLANPRRTIIAFAPVIAILIAGILSTLGVIGAGLGLALQACIIAFLLGQTSVLLRDSLASRRGAIAHLEGFIVHMHGVLEDDELSDENRRSAETALSAATAALDNLERSASRWTRRRERRAREKASL